MNLIHVLLVISILSTLSACGKSENAPSEPPAANVLSVQAGGKGLCGGNVNLPCTTVTLCSPGTTNCQTIPDILVDTGSVGLRVFSSLIQIPLTPLKDVDGHDLVECAQFGIGSDWGPLKKANVVLGGQPPVEIPIQAINFDVPGKPAACSDADRDPESTGFNGILGVGVFTEDCGSSCINDDQNGMFYSCSSGTCAGTALALSDQPQNPVSHLPVHNNGVLLQFPSVSSNGAPHLDGSLILGIGTGANNTPSSVVRFAVDLSGNFTTQFNGQTYASASFIDSGSNGLFFPKPSDLSLCASPGTAVGFFCPPSVVTYNATQIGAYGGNRAEVQFQIANARTLVSTGNSVFNNIGANVSGLFDWGFPFFIGKTVYVGIEGKSSPIGEGRYWAY